MGEDGKTLAVILARMGSKGLPGKNARVLKGKPLVGWTIEHAIESESLGKVVLSTDGLALAEIARHHGIDVVYRPAALASDTARVQDAARHAVEQVEQQEKAVFKHVVILYGNVPLRPADLTDRAVKKLSRSGADSVQSVCAVGKMHPYWMKKLAGESGDVIQAYEPNTVHRRQDLPPVYMLDGGVIAVRREALFAAGDDDDPHAFLGADRRAVVTEPGQVVDVDSRLDLMVAEAMLSQAGLSIADAKDGAGVSQPPTA